MGFNLLDDFMKFMNGNPDDPAQNSILQNMGLAANSQTNPTINELRSNMNGRAVNPLSEPWLGSVLPYPGMNPEMPGRAVLQEQPQPPPQPQAPPQQQDGMATTAVGDGPMYSTPGGQQASITNPQSITLTPPLSAEEQQRKQQQQTPQPPPPPRGMMESFIEQLPELALSGFANIGRGGMRYGNTAGYVGLGALRGLQGMAMPFAKSLHDDRLTARKDADRAAALAQYSQAMGHSPQEAARTAATGNLGAHVNVGEMAVAQGMQDKAEAKRELNETIQLAAPELAKADPMLRGLAIAQAKAGKMDWMVNIVAGQRLSPATRVAISNGHTLTSPMLVEIGSLPSDMQQKFFDMNAKMAATEAGRLRKIGDVINTDVDIPNKGTFRIPMQVVGHDQRGVPIWEQMKGPDGQPIMGSKFNPDGTSADQVQKQMLSDSRFWATYTRKRADLAKELEALSDDESIINRPPDGVETPTAKLARENQRAKALDDYKRRKELLDKERDEGPPIVMGKATKETAGAPKPPPGGANGRRFESLPPASQFPDKFATDTVTGKRMRSDGTKWIPAEY
jgi:hypothetical protein